MTPTVQILAKFWTIDSITDLLLDSNLSEITEEMINEGLGIASNLTEEEPIYEAFLLKKGYQLRETRT